MTLTKSFTAAGVSNHFRLGAGQSASYDVSNTYTGLIEIEESDSPTQYFGKPSNGVAGADGEEFSGTLKNDTGSARWYRFRAKNSANGDPFSGTADCELADAEDVVAVLKDSAGKDAVIITDREIIFTDTEA